MKFKYKEKVKFVPESFWYGQVGTIESVTLLTIPSYLWFLEPTLNKTYSVIIDQDTHNFKEEELVKIPKNKV